MLSYKPIPLKDRVFHSTQHIHSPLIHTQGRPHEYKTWHPDRLTKAYEAVMKSGYSVRRAAEEYEVPHSTLHDRVSGRIKLGATSGPPRYLTDEE